MLLGAAALIAATAFVSPGRLRRQSERVPRRVIDQLTAPLEKEGGVITKDGLLDASPWAVITETAAYKEADRRYRHVVYGYPEWVKHRSPDRYFRNLGNVFGSRVVRGIWFEVVFTMAVAAAVCFFYDADLVGFAQALALPENFVQIAAGVAGARTGLVVSSLPFTLTAALISLLLVFKTNSAYGRWWEARQIWGSVTNKCRDVSRQCLTRIKPKDAALKVGAVKLAVAFPFTLRYHLGEKTGRDGQELRAKMEELLPPLQTETIMAATHKPMTVLGLLSDTIHAADLSAFDELKMDQVLTALTDYYGMCERIFKTPMPLQYTRLTARFLSIWLLLLPFALYSQVNPHWLVVPICGLIAFFSFAIEDLSVQLEEPFSIQPLLAQAGGIQGSVFEALDLDFVKTGLPKPEPENFAPNPKPKPRPPPQPSKRKLSPLR